jgi:phage/plasmid-associated DNA primase
MRISHVSHMDRDELMQALLAIQESWADATQSVDVVASVSSMFDLDLSSPHALAELERSFENRMSAIIGFTLRAKKLRLIRDDEPRAEDKAADGEDPLPPVDAEAERVVLRRLYAIRHATSCAYHMLVCLLGVRYGAGGSAGESHTSLTRFPYLATVYPPFQTESATSSETLNPNAILIEAVQIEAIRRGFRRCGTMCYAEIMVLNENKIKVGTHAWVACQTIKSFVQECLSQTRNAQYWQLQVQSPGRLNYIVNYFEDVATGPWRIMKPNPRFISFLNGVYDLVEDVLMPFDDDRLDESVCAMNFIEQELSPRLFPADRSLRSADIAAPKFESIIAFQVPSPDVIQFVLAMLGRLLHPVNQYDEWQVMMYILGVAGCGKSSILHIVERIFPPDQVGIISSSGEPRWMIGSLHDKLVWMCPETKRDFCLSNNNLQSMISGDMIEFEKKGKDPVHAKLRAQGIMVGNEIPAGWIDASGALTRRIILLDFRNFVPEANRKTNLVRDILKEELGNIIVRITRAYHELREKVGDDSIWKHVPPYFLETKRKFSARTRPFEQFINDCQQIERSDSDFIAETDLIDTWHKYAKRLGIRTDMIGTDIIQDTMNELGFPQSVYVRGRDEGVTYRGNKNTFGTFYTGLRMKIMADPEPAPAPAPAPAAAAAAAAPPSSSLPARKPRM